MNRKLGLDWGNKLERRKYKTEWTRQRRAKYGWRSRNVHALLALVNLRISKEFLAMSRRILGTNRA